MWAFFSGDDHDLDPVVGVALAGTALGILTALHVAPDRFGQMASQGSPMAILLGAGFAGALGGAVLARIVPRLRHKVLAILSGAAVVFVYVAVQWARLPSPHEEKVLGGMLLVTLVGTILLLHAAFSGPAKTAAHEPVGASSPSADPAHSPAEVLTAFLLALTLDAARMGGAPEPVPADALPEGWVDVLRDAVPMYRALGDGLRERLHGFIVDFLDRVRFEGAGGMEITDQVRVTIAAQACMLLLGLDRPPFPDVRAVVVYPGAYQAPEDGPRWGQVHRPAGGRLGESWDHGTVVLSWASAVHGAVNPTDGRNVVFHEFAHQLDQEAGSADGVPSMTRVSGVQAWSALLHRELQSLRGGVDAGRRDVLDEYGATDEAEFFAVATETFFEKPARLHREHPELYAALKGLYALDPGAMRRA
jgi:Mlc titration factor MtfA (ptsG expression regulator)